MKIFKTERNFWKMKGGSEVMNKKGVLKIELKKTRESESKKIEIKS